MPRAVRKSAPQPVPEGKRAATAIGTRAMLDDMRHPAAPDDDVAALPAVRSRLIDWHGALAQISGTLVLAYGKQGLSRKAARALIQQLRLTATDIERHIGD